MISCLEPAGAGGDGAKAAAPPANNTPQQPPQGDPEDKVHVSFDGSKTYNSY